MACNRSVATEVLQSLGLRPAIIRNTSIIAGVELQNEEEWPRFRVYFLLCLAWQMQSPKVNRSFSGIIQKIVDENRKKEGVMNNIGDAYCNCLDRNLIKPNNGQKRTDSYKLCESVFAFLLISASCVSIWKAVSLVISFVNRMN